MARPSQAIAVALAIIILLYQLEKYLTNGTRRWFADELPTPHQLAQWSPSYLDQHLHELSRWNGFSSTQFHSFVEHQIAGLNLLNRSSTTFRFLEVGVGVGAFARHILRAFPTATGVGIDLEDSAIQLAKQVLPSQRMHLMTANMLAIPALDSSFEYVLVPGSLCYLHSSTDVLLAISEFVRVLKPAGALCASMLPSITSDMGSCNIRIPKSLWTRRDFGLTLLSLEEMDDWGLPHGMGRYSVCARKTG